MGNFLLYNFPFSRRHFKNDRFKNKLAYCTQNCINREEWFLFQKKTQMHHTVQTNAHHSDGMTTPALVRTLHSTKINNESRKRWRID